MSMFGPRMGSWWVYSKIDSRWNNNGRGEGFVTTGGPSDIYDWIDKCKELFGEEPDDLKAGFMKD